MSNDVYNIVTDKIISKLEDGIVPWRKQWTGEGLPYNIISNKPYSGVNVWLLGLEDYKYNCWLTYKQAVSLKGNIKKGSKGSIVTFWKPLKFTKDGEEVTVPLLRYYTVFNIEQTEGIPLPDIKKIEFNKVDKCEEIISQYINCPTIEHKEQRAFYRPSVDMVNMPIPESFNSKEDYYSVLFHELSHSTGHKSRLEREGITDRHSFGDVEYSKEELIAEMSACFLSNICGIETVKTFENSTAYLKGWLKVLRGDNKFIISASGQAQKAANWVQGIRPEVKGIKTEEEVIACN